MWCYIALKPNSSYLTHFMGSKMIILVTESVPKKSHELELKFYFSMSYLDNTMESHGAMRVAKQETFMLRYSLTFIFSVFRNIIFCCLWGPNRA